MKDFKVGDRVRVVKDEVYNWFRKGQEGIVKGIGEHYILVTFDNGREAPVLLDEIELIKPIPKPFPTFEEFDEWFYLRWDSEMKTLYNYFAQFGVREVFPEVNKVYEFSMDGKDWQQAMLISYAIRGLFEHNYALYIRPIQPTRLEELKSKHPNLSNDELIELLDILLTQMREQ
jgi:hypothetical protein